jgi:hypothetical protein
MVSTATNRLWEFIYFHPGPAHLIGLHFMNGLRREDLLSIEFSVMQIHLQKVHVNLRTTAWKIITPCRHVGAALPKAISRYFVAGRLRQIVRQAIDPIVFGLFGQIQFIEIIRVGKKLAGRVLSPCFPVSWGK